MTNTDLLERLLRDELGRAEDNLCRAKLQQRAKPDWTSGNDKPIADMVASYAKSADEVRALARAHGIDLTPKRPFTRA